MDPEVESDDDIKRKAQRVMRFIAEVARRRNPVTRRWTEYEWTLDLTSLPRHPAIKVGAENDEESVVLSVKRPKETPCDPPPQAIAEWIQPGWTSPDAQANHLQSRNFEVEGKTTTVAFTDDPQRVSLFEAWRDKRDKWAAAELPVRRVSALFQRLFELRGRLERESERVALCAGDGMLRWGETKGLIEHPLLLHRLELMFEPRVPSFELRYTDDARDLNSVLLRDLQVDGKALSELRNRLASLDFSLLDPQATDFLKEAVHRLFKNGEVSDARLEDVPDHAVVHRQAVIMLMPRSGGVINAIEAFADRLNEGGEVPDPLRSIITGDSGDDPGDDDGTEASEDDEAEQGDGGSAPRRPPVDLLLTKPANPEQQAVVRALARQGRVVVQGPPGTGKTHTIANLVGHLLAEGKSVLVTSHSTKALKVLRDKVADDLRPLCVARLDRDSEGQQLLEQCVNGIIAGLQRSRSDRADDAKRAMNQRERLVKTRVQQEKALARAIRDEYDAIVISGSEFPPSKAARRVREQQALHEWLPGPLKAGISCPLSDEEVREMYRLGTVSTPEMDAEIAAGLPSASEVIKPAEFEKAMGMMTAAASKAVDPFPAIWIDGVSQTVEELREVQTQAKGIVQEINGAAPLVLECMDSGRLGGVRREPWDDLVRTVEHLAREIDRHNSAVVKHSPALHEKWPREQALWLLEQIVVHVQARGSLSLWWRVRRPTWWVLQSSSMVRGARPTSFEDFDAVRSFLLRDQRRIDLQRRWVSQVATIANATHGNLGDRPEDAVRQHVPTITRAIEWHDKTWVGFHRRLEGLGFKWTEAIERIPPRTGACGELRRWSETIEKVVLPSMEARRARREAEVIQAKVNTVGERLARGPEGRIGRRLAAAMESRNPAEYAAAHRRYSELVDKKAGSDRRVELLNRLKPVAERWEEAVRLRQEPHHSANVPGIPSEAWVWRQLEQELCRRTATDVNDLQRGLAETKDRLQEETARYVSARVWERQHSLVTGKVRSALMTWKETVSTRGFESGVRSTRLKAEARRLMNEAKPSIPVWIMPLSHVVESYDFKVAQFDVVILDEASQCDMTGLVALGIAKSAIVVGDDKQVSPMAIGERLEQMQALIDEFLSGIPMAQLFTGRLSMYALATAGFGRIIRLVEHFRCVNEIIQFSNHLSYEGEIKPLRDSSTVQTRPFVVSHRVADAARQGHVNEVEATELASLIVAMCEQPEYAGKTFGVISMLGEEQALLIDRLVRERMTETIYADRELLCGTPPQFQGDERDVILLSLVDHAADGPLPRRADDDLKKRFNVAASRAKDQLWVVHSLNVETDLKEGDLRGRLIRHAMDPQATQRQLQEQSQRVESEFERLVLKSLTESGYRVQTQWKVGAFRIDMVVMGADGARVALECDGDRFHPPEEIGRDLDRQRILERLGWRFVRLRGSEYFRDPERSMGRIRAKLEELGVGPIGAISESEADPGPEVVRDRVIRRAEELRRGWAEEDASAAEEGEAVEVVASSEAVSSAGEVSVSFQSDDGDPAGSTVYAVIREARMPIGRAEIIERSGISPTAWTSAIRGLIRDGKVVMQGSKRGTRYSLPERATPGDDPFAEGPA